MWESFISSVLYYVGIPYVDWSDEVRRRIVLANLIEGVSSLERLNKHRGFNQGEEKIESMWTQFGFELDSRNLKDEDKHGGSYYGAIFKNKYAYKPRIMSSSSSPNPPEFIIAFRGTIIKPFIKKDHSHNLKFLSHKLHRSSRVSKAFDTVLDIVKSARRPENVWLTGHSLGAAISLAVGRKLVIEKGLKLESFLFNPPIVSSPIEFSRFVNLFIKDVVTSLLISIVHESKTTLETGERFNKLASWTPHMFINKNDPICNGFISYFQHRDTAWMGVTSAKKMVYIATQYSVIGLIGKIIGKDWEPIHLLPCANLTITSKYHFNPLLFEAHKIEAWMEHDLPCHNELYSFNHVNHSS